MLTDLLRINTSHITGLPQKYRENFPMKLISEHTITEASRQSLMS